MYVWESKKGSKKKCLLEEYLKVRVKMVSEKFRPRENCPTECWNFLQETALRKIAPAKLLHVTVLDVSSTLDDTKSISGNALLNFFDKFHANS